MTRQIQNVLVAGVCTNLALKDYADGRKPNGSLGESVIRNLKANNFNVTLLTRNPEKTKSTFSGLNVIQANYDSVDNLTTSLRNAPGKQDALIILISREEAQAQINLIDAAIATGVSHIIPSAFGESTTRPGMRDYPVLESKARMEDYLIRKAEEGHLTYTQIQTMAFFDWALDRGVFLNTKDPNVPTMVFDGGDVELSVTNVDDIGKAVSVSLLKLDQAKNKDLRVHTAVVTQNQLLAYAKEAAPDRDFKVVHLNSEELAKQALEKYHNGDKSRENMRSFIVRIMFGRGLGLFTKTDNDLLGVKQWNDDEVKEFVARYFK